MALEDWMKAIGREGRATAHRWITAGMIKPVNIRGRNYITREEDERFWKRASEGEFSNEAGGIVKQQKGSEGMSEPFKEKR